MLAQISAAQTIQKPAGNGTMQTLEPWTSTAGGQQAAVPYVRIAQLDIDPQRLAEFKAVLQESISTSVRVEPGVFALYAVALKENPHRFLVFEMYKDEATYNAHRETPHFRKFFDSTQQMVTSRTFLDVDPVVLGAKAHWERPGH
ncbi:putative quinol monooxygenase [Ralstonia pseudosolanacearum]